MEYHSKTDKITRVLMLYHRLLNGQHIDKTSFSLEHGINERSFDRDIEDVRLFLNESFSFSELIYDRELETYYLTGDRPRFMDRMDAAIISQLLLSSQSLRKDEAVGLFHALLSVVAPNDAKAIYEYLQQNVNQYQSQTDAALLKTLGDLYVVIHNSTDIMITFRVDDAVETIQIAPLEIEVVDSIFYLVGAEKMDFFRINRYRIDRIEHFQPLSSFHARTLKEKYYTNKERTEYGENC